MVRPQFLLYRDGYVPDCWEAGVSAPHSVRGVYACPGEGRSQLNPATNGWNTWKGSHYGLLHFRWWDMRTGEGPDPSKYAVCWKRYVRIPLPERVGYMADKTIGWQDYNHSTKNELIDAFRHNRGWNVAFVGGQVEWLSIQDTTWWLNGGNYGIQRSTLWGRSDRYRTWNGWPNRDYR